MSIPVYFVSFPKRNRQETKPNTTFQRFNRELEELKKERERRKTNSPFVRNFCEMSAGSPSNQFREKKSIRQPYHGNLPRFTTFRYRDFKIACKFHAGTTLSPTTACNLCVSLHAVYYWPRWFQNQPENSAMQATFKSLPPLHDGLLNAAWKENYTQPSVTITHED